MDRARESQARGAVYRRRRPERTPLYRAVQDHLETYLALAREGHFDAQGVPGYVEREFRRYLECGILARGFSRARCGACGHEFLIAFSCKGRGLCPSCNARRMAETARACRASAGQLGAVSFVHRFGAALNAHVHFGTGKGAVQLGWFSRPFFGPVRGYVQLFSGYGESLIDYNWNQTTIGAGIALSDGL